MSCPSASCKKKPNREPQMKGYNTGRTITQAVSRWLPIPWQPGQVMWDLWWIRGTEAGFLWVLHFALPIIPSTAPRSSSSIIWGKQWSTYQVYSVSFHPTACPLRTAEPLLGYSCLYGSCHVKVVGDQNTHKTHLTNSH
jgi:hypothetical protein